MATVRTAMQYKDAADLMYEGANPFAYFIRRLTLLERKQLQGFRDVWTMPPTPLTQLATKPLTTVLPYPV